MTDYIKQNASHWDGRYRGSGPARYAADNVESYVFRVYGRILKYELGLSGEKGEKMLDFGCGSGAVLSFFDRKGFDVYGVDIDSDAINLCKEGMPHIADHFGVIDPRPSEDDVFFGGGYDLVTSIETFYYMSPSDMQTRLISLKKQMKPGAALFITMKGVKQWYFNHSTPCSNGMRLVHVDTPRLKAPDYYATFIESREDMIETFSMFEPVHVGYFEELYREEEGTDFSWLFVGRNAS